MEYLGMTMAAFSIWIGVTAAMGLLVIFMSLIFVDTVTIDKHGSRILFWFCVASLTILFVMITALGRSVTIEKARQECRAVKPAVQLII